MESADPANERSLYRKYRSRSFADIVGQSHVKQTLRNAVRTGTVGHAYLFTGTRGTGKTSVARILARAANCLEPRDGEPCEHCAACQVTRGQCLDIVEIDAASHGSVDDARDLRGQANLAPMMVRRKVYIMDEAHMLSAQANDALLKVLEEPPPHVMFILATTDVHKIKITVASRCQRLDFRPISMQDITDRLAYVCAQEGLAAEREALALVAGQAGGSLRDALSLLEQVRAYESANIRTSDVQEALGLARSMTLAQLTDAIIAGNVGRALGLIDEVTASGVDLRQYTKQLLQYWRDLLLYVAGPGSHGTVDAVLVEQAGRISLQDVTDILKALLQPDTRERSGAPVRWQLELAVAQACQHFARRRPAQVDPVQGEREAGQPSAPIAAVQQTAQVVRPAAQGATTPVRDPVVTPAEQDGAVPPNPEPAVAEAPVQGIVDVPVEETPAATRDVAGAAPPAETSQDTSSIWHAVTTMMAETPRHRRIMSFFENKSAPVGLDGDAFVLGFHAGQPALFKDQTQANRQVIEEALARVLGRPVVLRCVTLATPSPAGASPVAEKPESFVQRAERAILSVHMDRGSH